MACEEESVRVLKQLPHCAQRNSEAHGKRFVPDVKVPEISLQNFAVYISAERVFRKNYTKTSGLQPARSGRRGLRHGNAR